MVVMSNQSYISKVSFLFSLADWNGSGAIDRPEFSIGAQSLFKGLARFSPTNASLSGVDWERAASAAFDKIDVNRSGVVELEEMLSFASRSRALRELVAPFPGQDQKDVEGLVQFAGSNAQQERRLSQKLDLHARGLRRPISVTPEPTCVAGAPATWLARKGKERERPWMVSAAVTKPRVYVMWWLFNQLKKGSQVHCGDLFDLIVRPILFEDRLKQGASELRPKAIIHEVDTMTELKVVLYLKAHLCTSASMQRLKEQAVEDCLSLRALLSSLWYNVPERVLAQGLTWCREFQALAALKELLKQLQGADVDPFHDPDKKAVVLNLTDDDVQALFDVVDQDGSGTLSIMELVNFGNLSGAEVKHLEKVWDKDRNGELSQAELLASIHGMSMSRAVRGSIKGIFAASMMARGGITPTAPPKPDGQFVRAMC